MSPFHFLVRFDCDAPACCHDLCLHAVQWSAPDAQSCREPQWVRRSHAERPGSHVLHATLLAPAHTHVCSRPVSFIMCTTRASSATTAPPPFPSTTTSAPSATNSEHPPPLLPWDADMCALSKFAAAALQMRGHIVCFVRWCSGWPPWPRRMCGTCTFTPAPWQACWRSARLVRA